MNSRYYRDFTFLGGIDLDFSQEVNRERDLELLKLQSTIALINNEIMNYLSKRKNISEYILDYRKKVLEELRDDEDKVAEYFDHERYIKEEAYSTIDRRLKELTTLKESPYFGRINFIDKEYEDEEEIYIGRFGLTPEGSFEPSIVDWRAPVASLFYKGSLGAAEYNSPSGSVPVDIAARRQYIIKKSKFIGMFDSAIDVKDEILQMVLSSNSGEKLKDIIMTLQEEQDEIIRQPREVSVIVNGVAGSGKTTIALHRVAYLLYNYREILKDRVLIIGPNDIFLEYISAVLPTLGETGVKQNTFFKFARELLEVQGVMDFSTYAEKIVRNDEEFINTASYKNSDEYIKYLDAYLDEMNRNYFKIEAVLFKGEEVASAHEIEELFNKHYSYMPLFKRSEKIKRILVAKLKNKRDEAVRKLKTEIKAYKESLSPEKLREEENNIEFNRRLSIRAIIREVMTVRDEIDRWITPEKVQDIYNKLNKNAALTQDDLAPMLYLLVRLKGVKFQEDLRHVVIDEAQDLTLLQLRLIKELTKATSYTIVGDANQRLAGFERESAMMKLKEVLEPLPLKEYTLNKSYRSTFEIMDYAYKYLKEDKIVPMVRKGRAVEELHLKDGENLADLVAGKLSEYRDRGLENLAVILPSLEDMQEIEKEMKAKTAITVLNRENMIYKGGTVLLPSYFAKGLEFDGVIVLNKMGAPIRNSLKYIMCTRALHELTEINY